MKCPFCDPDIIKNHLLYESKNVRVIHNIRPANKGQCIIVPKRHVTNIRKLTKEELIDLILTVKLVSSKYQKYLKPAAFNYGFNEGRYAGQMVDHFHFHVMPRMDGDRDKLPEYHLFHRNPKTKRNLSPEEMKPFVAELKKLFH